MLNTSVYPVVIPANEYNFSLYSFAGITSRRNRQKKNSRKVNRTTKLKFSRVLVYLLRFNSIVRQTGYESNF
jgi:hypothetical protein